MRDLESVLDGDVMKEEATATSRHSTLPGSRNGPEIRSNKKEDGSKSKEGGSKTVPFFKLFSFADSTDYLLMSVGTISAIGTGLCMPLMTIIMGSSINYFGESGNKKEVIDSVSKVALNYVYLALGAAAASFLQTSCWMITGERQAVTIRYLYLKTLLRQDVSYFDKETNTGEIIGRMSGDTVLIQQAMGEKVGKVTQLVATFIGGFVIAFIKGWLLTIVMLSAIPAIVFSGAVIL